MSTASLSTPHRARDDIDAPGGGDSEVLREALHLAELGLRVIPLGNRSKVPRIRRWQERGTSDPRTIRGWFEVRPDDNLGLLTGGGIIALDIDAGTGGFESFGRLTEERGFLPETALSETGSDGMHLLFRVEGNVGNRTGILPGLDLRGDGGQIVVAPSVHPRTGRPYTWVRHPRRGITAAPEWFVRWLAETNSAGRPQRTGAKSPLTAEPAPQRAGTTLAAATVASPTEPIVGKGDIRDVGAGPRAVAPRRVGDRVTLSAAMIARFPVPDFGCRHAEMTRAIGHLIGGGYDPALVPAVMGDWYAYFHALGAIRTDADEAAQEVDACVRSTLRKLERGEFQPAWSDRDHEVDCRRIRLDSHQRKLLTSGVIVTDSQGMKTLLPGAGQGRRRGSPRGKYTPNCKRVTQIGVRLCESDDERAFVEALVVHATHKILHTGEYSLDRVIRMTHGQLGRIAGGRHEGLAWGPQQVERLKFKYVTRETDSKPASRFELLQVLHKGERRPGHVRGRPSEYLPTGILMLIPLLGAPVGGECR